MLYIRIMLHRLRVLPGVLHIFDAHGNHLHAFSCLGRADQARADAEGNPQRQPTQPYGDTPTGIYAPARIEPTGAKAEKLGPFWIPLLGTPDGDARCARPGLGVRTGLGIHAGRDNDPRTQAGLLIQTNGCVRVLPESMVRLRDYIGAGQVLVKIEELE